MKLIKGFVLVLLVFVNYSYSQTFIQSYANIVAQTSQTNITTNLTEFEALGVKRRGTVALDNTLNWLKNKYLSYGYTASQMVEDPFTNGAYTCENLIVTKVGTVYPNTYVIICGHYDSLNGSGTNDNGSGVSTILEVARLLQSVPTEYSVKFINFSGEEDGLIGSQHYVTSVVNSTTPKLNIKLVFNIDQVGGVAGMTNNTITCERDTGNPSTNNAASTTKTNELITCVGLYSPLNTLLSYAYASDYMPFEDNNEVITGFYETNETTHGHSATDLLVNMDPVYVFNVAKAATGAMLHFAVASTTLSENSYNEDSQVSFFPNPAKDFLNINIGTLTDESYRFYLIDINGKVVLEKSISSISQIEKVSVNTLPKGIYLANLETKTKIIRKKIVIQ
ncbi:MAG TPA: M28 family peptidase [Flavobacterium sp.]|uniref:M28 family peptidase n=1 Tax=Flavobacterium sp. TaxID=239 RepID=UPI002B4ACCD2|nr:M28 family peptidase [Flavobacterium sp.]HLO73009.1 M28 family peptidase [Flavobacterium sp.]